jgi:hypothetical protein
MTVIRQVYGAFLNAGDIGITAEGLYGLLPNDVKEASIRAAIVNLRRQGYIRKIAEEPNKGGYACAVHAIIPGGPSCETIHR